MGRWGETLVFYYFKCSTTVVLVVVMTVEGPTGGFKYLRRLQSDILRVGWGKSEIFVVSLGFNYLVKAEKL